MMNYKLTQLEYSLVRFWLITTGLLIASLSHGHTKGENIPDWRDYAQYLGQPVERVTKFLEQSSSVIETAEGERVVLKAGILGVTVMSKAGIVSEVHFQILPGERIGDLSFRGKLPFIKGEDVLHLSRETLISTLTPPVSNYTLNGFSVTECFIEQYMIRYFFSGERIEDLRVTRKTRENQKP